MFYSSVSTQNVSGMQANFATHPTMALFSCTGPNSITPEILKVPCPNWHFFLILKHFMKQC